MISETAMKAIQVRAGIETCKAIQSSDWRVIIDRIIYDLDAAGDTMGTEIIRLILAEAWNAFPNREGHGFVDRHVEQALRDSDGGGTT